MKHALVFGATSAIAEATVRIWAARGYRLFLVGRDASRLERMASDLVLRGSGFVGHAALDLNSVEAHADSLNAAIVALGGLDLVLIAHGTLGNQAEAEQSVDEMRAQFLTNALSAMSLMALVSNYFERQQSGTLVVISSVAGERGRQSNYVYGAAKAAVSTFSQGLRQRLHKKGVAVVTVKPGFVDTPMTAAFRKGLLWAQPSTVAKVIVRAVDRRKPVVYAPWFWSIIMFVIRMIPESLFRRLAL